MFLSWVSQIVAMLDSEHGAAVHHIVSNIADSYPMALIYSVKISLEDFVTNGNSKICQFIYRWFMLSFYVIILFIPIFYPILEFF